MRLLPIGLLLGCVLAVAGPGRTAGPPAPPPDRYRGADALAARIDAHLAAGWAAAKATPARPADDAEFVRRVYLDLAGRIPSVSEARKFLADKRPDKRTRLVEALLDGPRYVTHFVGVWRALLLPEAVSNFQVRFQVGGFDSWLRGQLTRDAGYDKMARDLLTAPVTGTGGFAFGGGGVSPSAFYFAKEFKAEELASATARLFLGVNLGCAQCHHHPFADWKKEQFWSFAAFFAGVRGRQQGDFVTPLAEATGKREITIPGTEKVVKARYLDGKEPAWRNNVSSRATLAEWITSADNPYFARAAVNRVWAYLFGTGLIDPVDEMVGAGKEASHPAVLDDLAKGFVEHKFDVKWLLRTITATRAYQLSSRRSHPSQDNPRLFAKAALRGLTPEQLYDSVAQATGYGAGGPGNPGFVNYGGGSPRAEFIARFGNASEKTTEVQTSILQALTLMNGALIRNATGLQTSESLAAVCDAPFLDTAGRVEALYLATLSRKPTSQELAKLVKYVEDGGSDAGNLAATSAERDKRYNRALADVFWVLLNSGEFFLNH
jgi:hypothetical protein